MGSAVQNQIFLLAGLAQANAGDDELAVDVVVVVALRGLLAAGQRCGHFEGKMDGSH